MLNTYLGIVDTLAVYAGRDLTERKLAVWAFESVVALAREVIAGRWVCVYIV